MALPLGGAAWNKIISDGLETNRKRCAERMTVLLKTGVDKNEAMRQVYMPWKTREEWDAFNREYEKAFALPKTRGYNFQQGRE